MDSRSRKLPFCLSSSRSSYTVSSPVSSTLGSGGRLYSREPALNRDRLTRASSPYKPDLDKQSFRLLSSSRDHSGPDARSPSWKLPSLSPSGRTYDRSWAESPLSSRSKAADSEGRLGVSSGLLDASDDAESKRAKLSYGSRGLYSRTPGASAAGSTYCGTGLSSVRGAADAPGESLGPSWTSYRLLSRPSSSKTLLSSRDQETKNETGRSSLTERRVRTPGLGSSLYQTDRVRSTYAQGARPKETTYSPSSSSRGSPQNRVFLSSQHSAPRTQDFSSGTSSRFRTGSSSLLSSQEQTRSPDSSSSSRAHLYSAPVVRSPTTPTRPTPDVRELEARSSTRRLLSRLFSRRSSQDSSSGSSSSRSVEDDSPSTSGDSVDGEEGAMTTGVDPNVAETTSDVTRTHRADLSPIRERDGYRSAARRGSASWREAAVGSGGGGGGGGGRSSSWLSSSLRGRCPPLLSRLRRYTREESAASRPGSEEAYRPPQRLISHWDEHKTSQEEDDDDDDDDDEEEEEEEEEGAVGVDSLRALHGRRPDVTVPELEDFSPRRRADRFELVSSGSDQNQSETEDKTESSRNQEKLRRIKEKLLLEDSDEEEGDLCRICQMREDGSSSNPLIQPCRCTGSLQYVHQDCIKRWLRSKISSGSILEAISTCELCKDKLRLNIDNFDINELYWEHEQSEYDELISSGLYLVVLLHFYEQRFSDVLRVVDAAGLFNLARTLHEYMDNLETPDGESDDEREDSRPSVDFSDLDDDSEEY